MTAYDRDSGQARASGPVRHTHLPDPLATTPTRAQTEIPVLTSQLTFYKMRSTPVAAGVPIYMNLPAGAYKPQYVYLASLQVSRVCCSNDVRKRARPVVLREDCTKLSPHCKACKTRTNSTCLPARVQLLPPQCCRDGF